MFIDRINNKFKCLLKIIRLVWIRNEFFPYFTFAALKLKRKIEICTYMQNCTCIKLNKSLRNKIGKISCCRKMHRRTEMRVKRSNNEQRGLNIFIKSQKGKLNKNA